MDIIKKIKDASVVWQVLSTLSEKDLEKAITLAADYYYNTQESLLDDETYDIMIEKLRDMNPKSKIFTITGAPIKGKKVKLPYWMGSMDKIKTEAKLLDKWLKTYKGPYDISDKLDGISCLMVLDDGELKLYTRGDGTYGQDITHLLNYVNTQYKKLLKEEGKIAIRGELIMAKKTFVKYADVMSNARNMVAGVVNAKPEKLNTVYASDVDFVTYEIIEPGNMKPADQLKKLREWDLNVVYDDIYNDIDLDILNGILEKRKKKSIYEIDGIIVTDNHKHARNKEKNPEYAFAFKGKTDTAEVKVVEVIWEPAKDGHIIPTVRYEKVHLSQVDMEYTAGFNAKYIVDNNIGPGAIIKIVRSGDVIPYIMEIIKPAKKPSMPKEEYYWDKNEVNIILKNPEKNQKVIIKRLTKFVRDIGVENMSLGIVTRIVQNGYNTISKIIQLTSDDLLEIDGFQEKLANKVIDNLTQQLNKLDVLTLMVASNSFGRGFGERKLKKILEVYPEIVNKYRTSDKKNWYNKLLDLEGFDEITVNSFLGNLPSFIELYTDIQQIIPVKPYVVKKVKNGLFKDQKVVFTGFRSSAWEQFIEDEGGSISTSVSKNTTLLVFNDGEESSSKYKMAVKLGVKTIAKSLFAKKYGI